MCLVSGRKLGMIFEVMRTVFWKGVCLRWYFAGVTDVVGEEEEAFTGGLEILWSSFRWGGIRESWGDACPGLDDGIICWRSM